MKNIPSEIDVAKEKAKTIKAVVLDGDGVVFSGQVFIGEGVDGNYK